MKKGKNKTLLMKVTLEPVHAICKVPIFSDFGLEQYFGGIHIDVGEYSY